MMRPESPLMFHVDAFTATRFSGNPAAVCLLSKPAPADWMQHVAQEMNLSETAFLNPAEDGFDLRWFTPTVEVDLCGHATLASAHVLWETGRLASFRTARFHTKSGVLTATQTGSGWIEMDFPASPEHEAIAPPGLTEALGATPLYVGKSRLDYLVEVQSEDVVRLIQPDHARLRQIPVRGVMVTSRSADPGFDFVSRFFAPGSGIDEDPVTGSSHCCLAPFWSSRLKKTNFMAKQVSARGGVLKIQLAGERVRIAGQAVTVVRGELISS